MGIRLSGLAVLSRFLPGDILSLGYPDVIVPIEAIKSVFDIDIEKYTNNGKWHGVDYPLPETVHLFERFGCKFHAVDIHASRGVEEIVDLNEPAALGKHDIILDCGTIEHCFNIGQAMKNAASAVKGGGIIFHTAPLSMANHGFYNLNPTFFYDFYSQNGFEIEYMAGVSGEKFFEVPGIARFSPPAEASTYIVARKIKEQVIKWPMQSKYLRNPDLK